MFWLRKRFACELTFETMYTIATNGISSLEPVFVSDQNIYITLGQCIQTIICYKNTTPVHLVFVIFLEIQGHIKW